MEGQVCATPTPLEKAEGEQLASPELAKVKLRRGTEAILIDYTDTMRKKKRKKRNRTRRGTHVLVSGFFKD